MRWIQKWLLLDDYIETVEMFSFVQIQVEVQEVFIKYKSQQTMNDDDDFGIIEHDIDELDEHHQIDDSSLFLCVEVVVWNYMWTHSSSIQAVLQISYEEHSHDEYDMTNHHQVLWMQIDISAIWLLRKHNEHKQIAKNLWTKQKDSIEFHNVQ